jgi:hypothetical protein
MAPVARSPAANTDADIMNRIRIWTFLPFYLFLYGIFLHANG